MRIGERNYRQEKKNYLSMLSGDVFHVMELVQLQRWKEE